MLKAIETKYHDYRLRQYRRRDAELATAHVRLVCGKHPKSLWFDTNIVTNECVWFGGRPPRG